MQEDHTQSADSRQSRRLLIATPRGFCAGVERAVDVVERVLASMPGPVHVRKEIVHNRAVVEGFEARGVIFVDELDEVPPGGLVIFSAHGVSPAVREEAVRRGLRVIDATCPLVTKVHRQVQRYDAGRHPIVLIGHAGHDEVLGTIGHAPAAVRLVTSVADIAALDLPADVPLAYVTQTTLSVDETRAIVAALRARFPNLQAPDRDDICYATQNRQDAVKELAARGVGHLLVVGSPNSSNSLRLCEVAQRLGVPATLIAGAAELPLAELAPHPVIGLTAGASAPEHLVRETAASLEARGWRPEEVLTLREDVKFQLPAELRERS